MQSVFDMIFVRGRMTVAMTTPITAVFVPIYQVVRFRGHKVTFFENFSTQFQIFPNYSFFSTKIDQFLHEQSASTFLMNELW